MSPASARLLPNIPLFVAALLIINHFGRPFELFLVGLRIPAAITTLGVIAVVLSGALQKLYTPVGMALSALLAWMMFCVPFSLWKGGSASYVLWYTVFWVALMLMLAHAPRSPRDLIRVATVVSLTCTLYILVGTQNAGGRQFGFGTFGNADDIALMGGFAIPFSLLMGHRFKSPLWRYLIVTLVVGYLLYAVGKTATRTALPALALMLGVYFFHSNFRQKASLIAISTLALVSMLVFLPQNVLERFATIVDSMDSERTAQMASSSEAMDSTRQRRELIQDAIDTTLANPIFGVGPGEFREYRFTYLKKLYFPSHNTFGQISSESGIPGLFFFIVFLASVLVTNIRSRKLLRSHDDHPDAPLYRTISVHLDAALAYFAVCAFFMTCDRHPHQFVTAGMSIATYGLIQSLSKPQPVGPTPSPGLSPGLLPRY